MGGRRGEEQLGQRVVAAEKSDGCTEINEGVVLAPHPTVQHSCPGNGRLSSSCSQRRTHRAACGSECCPRSNQCTLLGRERRGSEPADDDDFVISDRDALTTQDREEPRGPQEDMDRNRAIGLRRNAA